MKEYEIYIPTLSNDGCPIEPGKIEEAKRMLRDAFGGYTHLAQRNEGVWKIGGVTFREEISIIRVIDKTSSEQPQFDMKSFKRYLETELEQEEILIVEREVKVL